jgi:eukaryotic-like serine/threonine-protein kinase
VTPAPERTESDLGREHDSRALPRKFGRYTLFDAIGKGGMAEIFLARAETELGATRLAVVKQILPQFSGSSEFADMLIHEAKLAARLNHAHIAQVFDLGREGDQLYIAMEYVEGLDLNALLRKCSQEKVALPVEFALGIVCDVLRGLDYAHRRMNEEGEPLGLVHRDVSPSNVLVSFEGEVKLCDFGIAHANNAISADSAGHEAEEALRGKAGYMSPEHARGARIDARADVFATGILLWELLAGRRLYSTKNDASLLEQARRADVPPLAERGLPDEPRLHDIVAKSLAKDIDDRYASASAMLRDLEDYMVSAKFTVSPLRLGDWMVQSFGTAAVTARKALERDITKSVPPDEPRTPIAHVPLVPPPVSTGDVAIRETEPPESAGPDSVPELMKHPVSAGAMRAFRADLEATPAVLDAPEPPRPVLEGLPKSALRPPPPTRQIALVVVAVIALVAVLVAIGMLKQSP